MAGRRPVTRHPVGKGIAIDQFPVYELGFGRLGHDFPAHWVPAFEDGADIFQVAGEGPGLVNVVRVAVSEDPAAVCAIFDGAEEEVDIWACT